MPQKIALACDHGGFELKESLRRSLSRSDYEIIDLGTHTTDSVDYPDLAHELARAIETGQADKGILICGTGIGISMAANRHRGVRAALCTDPYMAKMSREHNDANVLCLGGRVIGPGLAEDIVREFLTASFQGGRHSRRIDKIELR